MNTKQFLLLAALGDPALISRAIANFEEDDKTRITEGLAGKKSDVKTQL